MFEDAAIGAEPPGGTQPASHTLPESEKDRRLAQLERDIAATRDYLQSTIEEHEAVKEELKSAHEEVLSANEEFQSTNEELETAKEELQAANEELITTNDELRNRNRELSVINADSRRQQANSERGARLCRCHRATRCAMRSWCLMTRCIFCAPMTRTTRALMPFRGHRGHYFSTRWAGNGSRQNCSSALRRCRTGVLPGGL